jgi:ribonuclease Z
MFTSYLINDPFDDPGVYVELRYKKEALLFDLGDLRSLMPRKILKISHIFVSHTHMDHFIGFDHLLRICLGRDIHISLFGPPGFIKNVESKIGAYTWNLVENYTNDFVLLVTEVHEQGKTTKRYHCQNAFQPETVTGDETVDGTLVNRKDFTVKGAFLDHKIPSLAYALEETKHLNIKKNALEELGLPVGPWLTELKNSILHGKPDETSVIIRWKEKNGDLFEKHYTLGTLKDAIVKVTPGKKMTYIADAVYSAENARKILELAQGSDIMFIEAPFLEKDAETALRKYHLTAYQAGNLARKAGVKNVSLFHFSPKYKGSEHLLIEEAMGAFAG